MDETAFFAATVTSPTGSPPARSTCAPPAAGPARLFDVVPGRPRKVVADRHEQHGLDCCARVQITASTWSAAASSRTPTATAGAAGPLYAIRRVLRLGAEHLPARSYSWLSAGLHVGDLNRELTAAYIACGSTTMRTRSTLAAAGIAAHLAAVAGTAGIAGATGAGTSVTAPAAAPSPGTSRP